MNSPSTRFQLNFDDLHRIGRNFLLALLGAAASTLLTFLPEFQTWAVQTLQENKENLSPLVVSMMTGLIITVLDATRRFLTDYTHNE